MKFLSFCLFVVVALAVIEVRGSAVAEKYSVGIRITSTRSDPPKCTKTGLECTKDCSTLMLCSSFKPEPIQTTPCKAPNQYCVNGACTSNPGKDCKPGGGSGGGDFICTDVGIFPDLADCTKYHVCKDDGTSEPYQCSTGFVFNSQLSVCQIGRTPCTKINCAKATEANPFMLYTSNPAYYVFCFKNGNGVFEAIMFKCPNDQFEAFDVKTKECKFKCKTRGNFQNPTECGEYYYCSGANAQPILSKCPDNWVFDGTGCNRDVQKCQFTTTTAATTNPADTTTEVTPTTTEDPLNTSEDAATDADVKGLIDKLKVQIFKKICDDARGASDPITDLTICPQSGNPTATLIAKRFKTEKQNTDIVFVSVTIDTKDMHYHVKIDKDSGTTPVDPKLIKVKNISDIEGDIEYFD